MQERRARLSPQPQRVRTSPTMTELVNGRIPALTAEKPLEIGAGNTYGGYVNGRYINRGQQRPEGWRPAHVQLRPMSPAQERAEAERRPRSPQEHAADAQRQVAAWTAEERAALMLGTGRKRKHTPVHAMPAIVQINVPVNLNADAGGDVETIQLSAASALKPVRLEATIEVLSWLVTAVNSEERKKEVEAPNPLAGPQPKKITFRSGESCFSIRYPSGYFHKLPVPTTDAKGNPLGHRYAIVVQEYLERAKKMLLAHGGVLEDGRQALTAGKLPPSPAPTAVLVASSESSQDASEPSSQPSPSSLTGPLDQDEFGLD